MSSAQPPGSMGAFQLLPLVEAAGALGLEADRLLACINVRAEELEDPRCRLPLGVEFALWDALQEMTQDPLVALRVGATVRVGVYGAYEYVLRNSLTLRACVERAHRFQRLVDDVTTISLVETADEATLRVARAGGYPVPPRGVECLFVVLARLGREQYGEGVPKQVRFAHPAPTDAHVFEKHFGCPVRFGAWHNEIVVDRELVDRPANGVDPHLGRVLEDHLNHLLQTVPQQDAFILRARGAVHDALAAGHVSMDEVARRLSMSPRTLRRHLEQRGTSYKLMLDDLRRALALQLVEQADDPLDAIAARLGFSEPSTFYRAFKRWSGTTPAAHRAQHRS